MLTTTIHFPGNCDEAITFYKEAIGAEVKGVYYFKDAPPDNGMDDSLPPNFVMHSEILIFNTLVSMTDGGEKRVTGDNFTMTVTLKTADEVTSAFNKLADDGKIIEPLAQQFWADLCGSVEDRFGLNWHILTSS